MKFHELQHVYINADVHIKQHNCAGGSPARFLAPRLHILRDHKLQKSAKKVMLLEEKFRSTVH